MMLRRSLSAAVLVMILATAAGADKIAVDPNAGPPKTPTTPPIDARMAKKISYAGGYKRLHQVTEDLAKLTGATIRCGKDKDNWQVRDLPVTVYAKDIPAGALLQAVADATHTLLSVSRVSGVNYYKVWKDLKREKLVDQCLQAERKYAQDCDENTWDNLIRLKDIPDSALPYDNGGNYQRSVLAEGRCLAPVLEQVGRAGLERAFEGEDVRLTWTDLPESTRTPLKAMLEGWWNAQRRNLGKWLKNLPAEDQPDTSDLNERDFQRFVVRIERPETDPNHISVNAGLMQGPPEPYRPGPFNGRSLQDYAAIFSDATDPRISPSPKPPDRAKISRFKGDVGNPNLRLLKSDDDWKMSVLAIKVKLERPQDKKDLTCADVIAALAEATGWSFVCEDFYTHDKRFGVNGFFGSEMTLGEALKRLDSGGFSWLVGESQKLVVGWNTRWYEHHRNLIPERILANLQAKLNGSGVEIDDFATLAPFTFDQLVEWHAHNRYLNGLQWGVFYAESRGAWVLYDQLSPQDKALAKTEAGLPLGKLDPRTVSTLFAELNQQRLHQSSLFLMDEAEKRRKFELPTDPDDISQLSLRLTGGKPMVTEQLDETGAFVAPPKDYAKYLYSLKITGSVGDRQIDTRFGGPGIQFPYYSPEREAEIEKQKVSVGKAAPNTSPP